MVLIIVVVISLLCVLGGGWYGNRLGHGYYRGGGISLVSVLLIILAMWLTGVIK
jgi:hypothetical protein